ncbi:MAG: lysostaphin resistance A-like protein [Promethearchaeota archaeon]
MDKNVENRLQFALSIVFLAIINFIFRFIMEKFLQLIQLTEFMKISISYIIYAFTIICAAIIVYYIINHLFPNNNSNQSNQDKNLLIIEEKKKTNINDLFYGFTLKNFGSQLKTALIFICIIYIPLDALSYIVPLMFKLDVLDYEAKILISSDLGKYLLFDMNLMIIATVIVHFFVALREEFVFRGFYITMGESKINKSTAFIYSALLFSLAHLSYIFPTSENGDSIFFPFWWAFNALIIGITSAYYFVTKKRLWPLIISHWVNNIISALILRRNFDGYLFWKDNFMKIYLPIIIIGVFLLIIYRKSLSRHTKQLFSLFKRYFTETQNKAYFGIDLSIIIILWLITIF